MILHGPRYFSFIKKAYISIADISHVEKSIENHVIDICIPSPRQLENHLFNRFLLKTAKLNMVLGTCQFSSKQNR